MTVSRGQSSPATDAGRRSFLRKAFLGALSAGMGPALGGCGDSSVRISVGDPSAPPTVSNIPNAGPLGPPDANGLRLPEGFSAKIVARSSQAPLPSSGYVWHNAPDGGATFPTADDGWVYVSNSEISNGGGGVGALRFDANGELMDAYSILDGTSRNCAGGLTPWGTWLSCEEVPLGIVWECDPMGRDIPQARPALGAFWHEAAVVDPDTGYVYLTEDHPSGRLYRFVPAGNLPDGRPDLNSGRLQVALVDGDTEGAVSWTDVTDPTGEPVPTRDQVVESTAFRGGEGMWIHDRVIYFSTKGDNRIWAYSLMDSMLFLIYDDDFYEEPILRGVDNVTVSSGGDVLVAEDFDDMQLIAITPDGVLVPLVQIEGQPTSEITGPAFNPAGDRLYFSSQRGTTAQFDGSGGLTYEMTGPFFLPVTGELA